MEKITKNLLKGLYRPPKDSHKGQNGKLTIVGGSRLFHGASLWALKTASRIVDMVFYATVPENEELTKKLKSEIYDFIFIPRGKVEDYVEQSDAILIGPGLVRGSKKYTGTGETGEETKRLTKRLLDKFPKKKWVIDAGSLQVMDVGWLKRLENVVITPHLKEFRELFKPKTKNQKPKTQIKNLKTKEQFNNRTIEQWNNMLLDKAKECGITIVLKGPTDIICSTRRCLVNKTGNEGMTKGGTGDVLAGLIAALACKNKLLLAAAAGTYINGLAGDRLYKRVGPYFNASDLCDEIPKVMKKLMEF